MVKLDHAPDARKNHDSYLKEFPARNLDLEDRIDEFVQAPAYITVKDHKPGFPNKVQCRLINPARSNIGCKSKQILEKIVREIKSATAYNQWQSSTVVIQWFKTLENKHQLSFFKFDVVSFYPSISYDLFNDALK